VQIYGVELTPEQVYAMTRAPGITAGQAPAFEILQSLLTTAPSNLSVKFPSSPSYSYRVLASGDLVTWVPAVDALGSLNSVSTVVTVPAPSQRQFYKVDRLNIP
jgi:hypothetical protein